MSLTITINITDEEQACLENDLLDINQWLQDGVKGKINNCKERLIKEWQPKLFADSNVTTMPANEKDFINTVLLHPDYKKRTQREPERKLN